MERRVNVLIEENDHVLLKKEKNMRVFKVKRKRDVFLDKAKFCLDGIIGHPYGTTFEVINGKMVKLDKTAAQMDTEQTGKVATETGSDKDNRNLQDSDSNQKLSRDEIEQMKKEGVTGEKLIEQLIENSTTFQEKTEYSKEKWVKKKKKKHLLEFTVLKPNSRLLCQMHWSKGPVKICNLRIDSLAQILTQGNIRAGMTVGVVDSCIGLVTGAVLERLGGFGKVISFYPGESAHRNILDPFDFPKEVLDTLHYFPLNQVNSLKSSSLSKAEPIKLSEDISNTNKSSVDNSTDHQTGSSNSILEPVTDSVGNTEEASTNLESQSKDNVDNLTGPHGDSGEKSKLVTTESAQTDTPKWTKKRQKDKLTMEEKAAAREERAKEIETARNILLKKKIDCLIVASKFHATPIVMSLMDYIAPSRQILVFSQFKEAVEDSYVFLRERGGVINFRLTETWLREYQVLPMRTHPVINMSGTGGYILSATKVIKPSINKENARNVNK